MVKKSIDYNTEAEKELRREIKRTRNITHNTGRIENMKRKGHP